MPTLAFWSKLEIKLMENTIVTEDGDIGRPMRYCRSPKTVEFHLEKVTNYHGKWLLNKKIKIYNQVYQKQRFRNH